MLRAVSAGLALILSLRGKHGPKLPFKEPMVLGEGFSSRWYASLSLLTKARYRIKGRTGKPSFGVVVRHVEPLRSSVFCVNGFGIARNSKIKKCIKNTPSY